ncbi:MAG: hypothetical protein JWN04_2654 [Myxococcaceae bacterium]|nr:hypothetical protein [Myxococcaceae bacterium]
MALLEDGEIKQLLALVWRDVSDGALQVVGVVPGDEAGDPSLRSVDALETACVDSQANDLGRPCDSVTTSVLRLRVRPVSGSRMSPIRPKSICASGLGSGSSTRTLACASEAELIHREPTQRRVRNVKELALEQQVHLA